MQYINDIGMSELIKFRANTSESGELELKIDRIFGRYKCNVVWPSVGCGYF